VSNRFLEALARGPVLLDAGMGTRLIARGLDLATDDPALWVIDHPLEILEIHRQDIEAGSEALLSNTFGANRGWLERFRSDDETWLINTRAVDLARKAAGRDRFVIGSIGPTASDHPETLREQAEILVGSGVDALILETHRLDQACSALESLRDLPTPILASLFAWPESIEDSAHRLIDRGAVAIGANCMNGMAPALELARRLKDLIDHPLLIKPSAGLPGSPLESPRSFADAVPELVACGVRLIGGCCGTTETHIAAMRSALDRPQKS
jgi:5-methyltetrahydrofolate--homocysteine methyltransferase